MSRPIVKLADIEHSAIKLFASRGIGQVTIRAIAAEAGCAEGALYRHYASKHELAWSLFRREVHGLAARLTGVLGASPDHATGLREAIRVFYELFDADPELFGFILLAQHNFGTGQIIDPSRNPIDIVAGFIREGIEEGEFRSNEPALASSMFIGIVMQPATFYVRGRIAGPLSARVDAVYEAALMVLGAGRGEPC